MLEKEIAQLRTSHLAIVTADMPVDEAVKTYYRIVDEDKGVEITDNLYADESSLVEPVPLIKERYTLESQVSNLLETGRDVLDHLAQRHQVHVWRVPGTGVEAVQTTFKPWITSDPLTSLSEAIKVVRGIRMMETETFIDYTKKK